MNSHCNKILLVHGSFHNGTCWNLLVPELQKLGFQTYVVTLPGHDNESKNKAAFRINLSTYTRHIAKEIQKINEPVILLGHSMSGAVISMVGEQNPSMISHLIYLSAIVPRKHDRMISMSKDPRGVEKSLFKKAFRFPLKVLLKGRIDIEKELAKQVFYTHLACDEKERAIKQIINQPFMPFFSKITWTDDNLGHIKKSYIECSLDKALPLSHQRLYQKNMIFSSVKTLESDHSPFLTMVLALANTIMNIIDK